MKRIVTESDIQGLARGQKFVVKQDMIITPLAREWASRNGVILEYESRAVPNSEAIPLGAKAGDEEDLEKMAEVLAQEVLRGLGTTGPGNSPAATGDSGPVMPSAPELEDDDQAIVVATGVNQPGVAAALSNAISNCGADINDISQTLAGEYFSMIFVVDTSGIAAKGLTFMDFKDRVEQAGKGIGAQCVVFHAKILKAMHRI